MWQFGGRSTRRSAALNQVGTGQILFSDFVLFQKFGNVDYQSCLGQLS